MWKSGKFWINSCVLLAEKSLKIFVTEFCLTSECNKVHSTLVLQFQVTFAPGMPAYEQVAFAARKAIVSGKMRSGDPFPSVRALSKAVKIHANTAQRVIAQLQQEGLLEVRPGVGTVVAQPPSAPKSEKAKLLRGDVEQLTVEALRLGISLEELQESIAEQWRRLKENGR